MKFDINKLSKDGLQMRVALDEDTVTEYAEAMREGAAFPPVKVFSDVATGCLHLADGFHRVEAATRAGLHDIEADITAGTFLDALRYALKCNSVHGKRVTNEDKRRALEIAWKYRRELFGEHDPSSELLARTCGVSRSTADRLYEEMFVKDEHLTPQRVTPSGRLYTLPTRPLPVRPAAPAPAPVAAPMPRPAEPEHLVPTDRFGVEIPLNISKAFELDALKIVVQYISAARSAIRNGIDEGDVRFAAVRQDALIQLNNAYEFTKAALPHCVCRLCQGQGCRACHDRGFQTEEEYERNPSEFKA